MSTYSQCVVILEALQAGRTLTPLEALDEFGCFRLAARIYDLRKAGYDIYRGWGTNGEKRWAEYRLISSGFAEHSV